MDNIIFLQFYIYFSFVFGARKLPLSDYSVFLIYINTLMKLQTAVMLKKTDLAVSISDVKTLIKYLLIWRKGYEDVWRGLKFWVCGFGGAFLKSVRSRGRA